jgi:hypothetical protein
MANLVAEGQVGLTEEGAAGALDIWQPAIVGRRVGGALQLEVAPHLRHGQSQTTRLAAARLSAAVTAWSG